jgi:hypothetical protein
MPPLDAIATLLLASETNRKINQKKRNTDLPVGKIKENGEKKNKKGCSTHHHMKDSREHHIHFLEHQHDWDGVSLLGGSIQCLLWMQLQFCCCHLKQTTKINKKKRRKTDSPVGKKENGEKKQQKGCSTHHKQDCREWHMPSLEHQHDWDGVSLLGGSIQCLLWMQLQLCCHLKQTTKINKKKEKHRFTSWKEREWRESETGITKTSNDPQKSQQRRKSGLIISLQSIQGEFNQFLILECFMTSCVNKVLVCLVLVLQSIDKRNDVSFFLQS